jgi:hypothetical protein
LYEFREKRLLQRQLVFNNRFRATRRFSRAGVPKLATTISAALQRSAAVFKIRRRRSGDLLRAKIKHSSSFLRAATHYPRDDRRSTSVPSALERQGNFSETLGLPIFRTLPEHLRRRHGITRVTAIDTRKIHSDRQNQVFRPTDNRRMPEISFRFRY